MLIGELRQKEVIESKIIFGGAPQDYLTNPSADGYKIIQLFKHMIHPYSLNRLSKVTFRCIGPACNGELTHRTKKNTYKLFFILGGSHIEFPYEFSHLPHEHEYIIKICFDSYINYAAFIMGSTVYKFLYYTEQTKEPYTAANRVKFGLLWCAASKFY